MIKVFEVIADSSLSGAPRHVLTLLNGIDRQQFESVLVCPEGWLANRGGRVKVKVKRITFKSFFDVGSVVKLRRFIKQEKPDIVHSHGIRAGWLVTLACTGLKVKKVYSEHLYTEDYHLKNKLREYLQLLGLKVILRNSIKVICPSKAVSIFLNRFYGRVGSKLVIVANGIKDFKTEDQKTKLPTFGFIGSLNYHKGIYQLFGIIDLVSRKASAKFEIVGDGPLRSFVERRASLNDSVSYFGEARDIGKYLGRWRAVLVPSLSESFGQVVLEASIAKKPVVAYVVGGLRELVKNGKSGILVRRGDVESFADSVIELIKNPERAKKMGAFARKIYEREFTAEKMCRRIELVYKQVVEKS
ncbi:MAG: glycosyltransferase family 4 protein [Candidatus Berkelbacteria bacterium]|nr:glycosyltransferase family 4 protein [Candidatus Berkelbacteria bacterium]